MVTMVVLATTGFAVGIGGPSRDMVIKRQRLRGRPGVFMDRGWYGATLLGTALVLLLSVGAVLGVGVRMVPR